MKTKLDELLEKWRFTASVYHGGMTHEIVTDLEAIKDSLNYPVDEPQTKPFPLKVRQTEQEKFLEAWMREVTNTLFFLTSVPQSQKDSTGYAFNEYRKSIGKPL